MITGLTAERSLGPVVLAVALVHVLLIWWVSTQLFVTPAPPPRKPLVVQSIRLQPTTPIADKSSSGVETTPQPKPKPKAKPKAKPKPKPEAKAEPKPAEKKPKPVEAKKTPKIAADKLAQAKANLNQIHHSTPTREQKSTSAVSALPELASAIATSNENSYEEILAERLRLLLTLPDYGDVKIKLTVSRIGHVVSVDVLQADSEENRQYVLKTLPMTKLPAFGKDLKGRDQETFRLVLSND